MNIITVNSENIDNEHICCAISDKPGENCVKAKKLWLKERFKEGLVFKKLDVRGKAFIEYIPAENAWCPIEAEGYMFIDCFWISGQFKGKGYSNQLLEQCIADAKQKGKIGLTVLSSIKKMPFLSDPKYLKYKGFRVADSDEPSYELLFLPFSEDQTVPQFKECAKTARIQEDGMVLYYSNQCPYAEKYGVLIKEIAEKKGIGLKLIKFETTEQAQNAPKPFTVYSLFNDGEFITNEILSEKKFIKFLEEKFNI